MFQRLTELLRRLQIRENRFKVGAVSITILSSGLFLGLMTAHPWRTNAQTYQQLWPRFTMVYTVQEYQGAGGSLSEDRTWRLVVTNDQTWRAEILRDGINPREVGSYKSFVNGKVTFYSAAANNTNEFPVETALVNVTTELVPTYFKRISLAQVTAGTGWRDSSAAPIGQVEKVQTTSTPCPSTTAMPSAAARLPSQNVCGRGITNVMEEHRVAFDARTIRTDGLGGIAVSSETKVNGKTTRLFHADSLEIQSPIP